MRLARAELPRSSVYHGFDTFGEPDGPAELDYFVYLLRNEERTVLVDTGGAVADLARRPGREALGDLGEALGRLGAPAGAVEHLILTHLHWDHVGNLDAFPAAELVLPAAELAYWTDPATARSSDWAHTYPAGIDLVRAAARDGRVRTVEGTTQIFPGVEMLVLGGHSPGQAVLVVDTADGRLALASDAVHFYEERGLRRPFALFHDLAALRAGYEVLDRLEREGALVVPGHDAEVTRSFPPLAELGDGLGVRLG